jgi:hypothetical protein
LDARPLLAWDILDGIKSYYGANGGVGHLRRHVVAGSSGLLLWRNSNATLASCILRQAVSLGFLGSSIGLSIRLLLANRLGTGSERSVADEIRVITLA